MRIVSMPVGFLGANCYILFCENKREAAIIDPGGDEISILYEIETRRLRVKYIILTHGHFDHIGAVKALKLKTGANIAIHSLDAHMLTDNTKNLSSSMGIDCSQVKPDLLLEDGDVITIGEIECRVVHTPGHSRGSICIIVPGAVFSGDTLFKGSIGRTDLWGGDYQQLMSSINEKLLCLEDSLIVYPGHGDKTTIGVEKRTNPFLLNGKDR